MHNSEHRNRLMRWLEICYLPITVSFTELKTNYLQYYYYIAEICENVQSEIWSTPWWLPVWSVRQSNALVWCLLGIVIDRLIPSASTYTISPCLRWTPEWHLSLCSTTSFVKWAGCRRLWFDNTVQCKLPETWSYPPARPQQWIKKRDTSSQWSTGMFCHEFFTILNHMPKCQTPSLDKDSATELKACDWYKFWILWKKPDLFWFNMTGSSTNFFTNMPSFV